MVCLVGIRAGVESVHARLPPPEPTHLRKLSCWTSQGLGSRGFFLGGLYTGRVGSSDLLGVRSLMY